MVPPNLHLMHDTASKGTPANDQQNSWLYEQGSFCFGGILAQVSNKDAKTAVRGGVLHKVLHVVRS